MWLCESRCKFCLNAGEGRVFREREDCYRVSGAGECIMAGYKCLVTWRGCNDTVMLCSCLNCCCCCCCLQPPSSRDITNCPGHWHASTHMSQENWIVTDGEVLWLESIFYETLNFCIYKIQDQNIYIISVKVQNSIKFWQIRLWPLRDPVDSGHNVSAHQIYSQLDFVYHWQIPGGCGTQKNSWSIDTFGVWFWHGGFLRRESL